jgi:uncharacterized membrane protein
MQRMTSIRNGAAWAAVMVCVLFGAVAIAVGVKVGIDLIGGTNPGRAAPPLFILHAVTGGIALMTGAINLRVARPLLRRRPNAHRFIGRIYVYTAWITSLGSLFVVAGFDVGPLAKAAFTLEAVLWFAATTVAFHRIRTRRIRQHREWMIRSFALALFFVTGGVWLDAFEGSSLYPLSVFLSWAPNLAVAELWIRNDRGLAKKAHMWAFWVPLRR